MRSQNVGTTYEFLVSIPPGIIVAALALFSHQPLQQVGLVFAIVAIPTSSLFSFLGGIEIAYDRTERATVATGVGTLVTAALTIVGLKVIGPTAMFFAPFIGNVVAIAILLPRLVSAGLRPDTSSVEAVRLLRTGYPLAAASITYWTYRWVGPLTVTLAFGSLALGFYSLANAPVVAVTAALALGARIFMPRFWGQISRGERHRWIKEGDATTSFFIVIGCICSLAGQATFPWFIREFLHHYQPSVLIFAILALEIPLYLGAQAHGLF